MPTSQFKCNFAPKKVLMPWFHQLVDRCRGSFYDSHLQERGGQIHVVAQFMNKEDTKLFHVMREIIEQPFFHNITLKGGHYI